MTLRGGAFIRPLTILVVLLVPAAAGQGTLDFDLEQFELPGQSVAEGSSNLLHMEGVNKLVLQGTGDLVAATHYTTRSYELVATQADYFGYCNADDFLGWLEDQQPQPCADEVSMVGAADVDMHASVLGSAYYVRAYTLGGEMDVSLAGSSIGGEFARAIYAEGGTTPGRLETAPSSEDFLATEDDGRGLAYFATRDVTTPKILVESQSLESVHLAGDLVLEFLGPVIQIGGGDFQTGAEIGVGQTGLEDVYRFMRLQFSDASFRVETDGLVQYVADGVQVSSADDLLVAGAPDLLGAQRSPAGQTLAGPIDGRFLAGDNAATATLQPAAVVSPPAWYEGAASQNLIWIAAGILFLLAIGAVIFRQATTPPLPSIEAALESGNFRRAARMSNRVLRRNPLQESAQLARAIAWSRMGAHDRIVRHLEPFLRRHDPSDGTLHYVYGLALHDEGSLDAARSAMAEAVRRTPSLLPDVANELRPSQETEGYS